MHTSPASRVISAQHFLKRATTAESTYDQLRDLDLAVAAVEIARAAMVHEARKEGMSWEQIGMALQISKQAAHKRYAL